MKEIKTKSIILITCLILTSLFAVSSGIAKHPTEWEDYAYGTLTNYYGDPDIEAELVDGVWNLKIKDNTVWFYSSYLEMNIDEEEENSPEDSIDIIEFTLQGQPFWKAYLDGVSEDEITTLGKPAYVVMGKFQIKKTWAISDGTYTMRTWKTWLAIEVYADGDFVMNGWPPDLSDWDQMGKVTDTDLFP